jgi:hypothetical protein
MCVAEEESMNGLIQELRSKPGWCCTAEERLYKNVETGMARDVQVYSRFGVLESLGPEGQEGGQFEFCIARGHWGRRLGPLAGVPSWTQSGLQGRILAILRMR